ncbi:MAG: hypothetical protein R2822_21720 [Spirosomataceae bacterium]
MIVAALGYFVDVYDLVFNIVRVPSLKELGLNAEEVSLIGSHLQLAASWFALRRYFMGSAGRQAQSTFGFIWFYHYLLAR